MIEGAADGAGLGHEFLRHIERTTVIVHLLDIAPMDGGDPVAAHEAIRGELSDYSPALAEKPEIIVLNKIDLVPEDQREDTIEQIAGRLGMKKGERPLVTSGVTGEGRTELMEACWAALGKDEPVGWGAS